ncbi:DUF1697 domain-containing protein [Massilia endophytica]|uniref:DUF1697 domain-containing protein n=1 Tax=Massilia endophytica TaxID=2899220 RepID=UPI001E375066|nr:DUF1697 domain-containing protein [Massilia endophytica]UGQ46956.1 DUF1697 domain-containing protein [Massilia endophytica]
MPRYVALLRGVSPMNAKMPELKAAFESAGFTNVRTLLSSGNVAFDAPSSTESALERKAERAMQEVLGRSFYTIVRRSSHLNELLAGDPYAGFGVPPEAKRVVSFLRDEPQPKSQLPVSMSAAQIVCVVDREVFSAYLPNADGPVFMRLIEKTFGTNITTRTWDTVRKCAAA